MAPNPIPQSDRRQRLFTEDFISTGHFWKIPNMNGSGCSGMSLERFTKRLDAGHGNLAALDGYLMFAPPFGDSNYVSQDS
jgi:hypothetical protein